MIETLSFTSLLVVAGLAGWFWQYREPKSEIRLLKILVPISLVVFLSLVGVKVYGSIFQDWSWIRLQMSFVLASGTNPYHALSDGPVLLSIYAPLSAVIFFPATWVSTPEELHK